MEEPLRRFGRGVGTAFPDAFDQDPRRYVEIVRVSGKPQIEGIGVLSR